jgi:hypothetical protein
MHLPEVNNVVYETNIFLILNFEISIAYNTVFKYYEYDRNIIWGGILNAKGEFEKMVTIYYLT